jgi:hypothetical protein
LVASREAGCDNTVRNVNTDTADDSYSLCQLNAQAGHFGPHGILSDFNRWQTLKDFDYAAHACAHMWQECGRGPWNYGNYYCKEPNR